MLCLIIFILMDLIFSGLIKRYVFSFRVIMYIYVVDLPGNSIMHKYIPQDIMVYASKSFLEIY